MGTFAILFGTIFARSEPPQTFFNFFAKLGLRPACFLRINRPMANLKPSTIRDSDIVGLKYFDRLMPLLEKLHDVGTQRDRAGNRTLFFDHYCSYLLLFFFNPIVTSLRSIQQASELPRVQK